jgi:peptidoglycan/LPS O-acetylase OafA/YrhL
VGRAEGGRDLALDGLRGFAVAIVVWGHTTVPWAIRYPPFPAGWFGVEVFFALSGYLITRTLLADSGPGALTRFWIRRFCRIVPAFVVMALLCLVFFELRGHRLALLTYTLNFDMALQGRQRAYLIIGHVWSLCVEEHFYLLWPPVALALFLARRRLALTAVGVALLSYALALSFAIRGGAALGYEQSRIDDAIQLLTPFRVGTLLLGALPAILGVRFGNKRLIPVGAALIVAALLVPQPVGFLQRPAHLVSQSLLASGIFYVVLSGLGAFLLSWRPLTTLGQISYGVYLAHVPLLWSFHVWGGPFLQGPDATWRVLPAYALILTLAWLSFRYFESPIIRWGRAKAAARTPQPESGPRATAAA